MDRPLRTEGNFAQKKIFCNISKKQGFFFITFRLRQIYGQNVKEIDPLEPKCDEPLLERDCVLKYIHTL